MKKILLLVPLMLFAGAYVQAQDALPLSLEDAIAFAIRNSDTIKNAQLNVAIQRAQNAQVAAQALPRIAANGNLIDNLNPQQSLLPGEFFPGGTPGTFQPLVFTPLYTSSAYMTGSQTLFDGGLLVALKARKTIVELVQQAGTLTTENLRYGIQRAYYSIVIARRQYNILLSSLSTAREIAKDIDILHTNGFNELIDVQRTGVQVNNLSTDSIRTASLIESSEQLLKYQMGMDISQPIILTDTAVESYMLEASAMLDEHLEYTSRTEYNLFNTQLKLNEFNLKRYQYAALPTLAVSGQVGYNYGSNAFVDVTRFRQNYLFSSFVALQLNIPIFSGFLRKNQVKEARLNIEKTKNNIHALELGLDFQNAQAKTTLKNSLLALDKQKRNLDLSNSILDLSNRKYKAGVGSSLEVNQAQTDLLLSQNNYFQSLLEVINAQSDLQRALGQFK